VVAVFEKRFLGSKLTATLMVLAALAVTAISGKSYVDMRNPAPGIDRVVPAAGFEHHLLSEWFEGLAGTPGDADIYIQEGEEPGGTMLLLGGTHANEPAGFMAAVVMLETAQVKRGRLIIAPFANPMARTHTFPQDAHPQTFGFTTPSGTERTFRFGARITDPVNEWPNPDIYIHPASGQTMAGIERSNLNRAHPGRADGGPTERLAHGYMELIKQEKVDLAIDIHEAAPEYPVVDALVAHENAMELAAMVAMELEFEGVPMRLEPSPANLRGLNHREWGDNADVLALLMETCNASHGRFRGKTDVDLILTGEDKAYDKAAGLGRLFVPWESYDKRFEERVARHVTTARVLADNLEYVRDGKGITIEGLPEYQQLSELGVGAFLSE
jgi:hypothetical protein